MLQLLMTYSKMINAARTWHSVLLALNGKLRRSKTGSCNTRNGNKI